MSWESHLPADVAQAVQRLAIKSQTPNCMGSPSFAAVSTSDAQLVGALVATQNLSRLQELRTQQATRLSQVNVQPYPHPEDMAESLANDYGEDLEKHYKRAVKDVDSAISEVRKQLDAGKPPRFSGAQLAAFTQEADKKEEEKAAQMAAKVAGQRKAAAEKDALVQSIVDAASEAGGSAAVAIMDLCNWEVGERALKAMVQAADSGTAIPGAAFEAVIGHVKTPASGALASLLCQLAKADQQAAEAWRTAAVAALASKLTSPKGEFIALFAGSKPLLLQMAYEGRREVVDPMLDAYERALARDEVVTRLTGLHCDGMTALHMAARAFGPAREHCPHIVGRLARYIDPNIASQEQRTVFDYIKACQKAALASELEEIIKRARS